MFINMMTREVKTEAEVNVDTKLIKQLKKHLDILVYGSEAVTLEEAIDNLDEDINLQKDVEAEFELSYKTIRALYMTGAITEEDFLRADAAVLAQAQA